MRLSGLVRLAVAGLASVVVSACGSSGHAMAAPAATPRVCSPALSSQRPLHLATRMVAVSGNPFGVVSADGGAWSFVSTLSGEVAVLDNRGRRPRVVREITLPGDTLAGEALTNDGRHLLVADGSGADVVDVGRMERDSPHPVLGKLVIDARSTSFALDSAIEVSVSPDDRFAFVSLESANEIAVFNLDRALKTRFRRPALVGTIPLGLAVVGTAISPDGRWLYATSEARSATSRQGTISVINLKLAETRPSRSVVESGAAGCDPVRVAVSPDGAIVWVAARESNSLLAFSAPRLQTDPRHAMLARVRVGASPVGLALLRKGARIVVADSNRFGARGQSAALTVIDAEAALAGKAAVIGEIPSGMFPRELFAEPSRNRLLVTNFASNQLEVIDLRRLP
jgi:DNA-binding beta-propeller fold protein YncE